jgi:erythromycin esterase
LEEKLTAMSGADAMERDSQTETNDLGKAFDGIIYLNKTNKINWSE